MISAGLVSDSRAFDATVRDGCRARHTECQQIEPFREIHRSLCLANLTYPFHKCLNGAGNDFLLLLQALFRECSRQKFTNLGMFGRVPFTDNTMGLIRKVATVIEGRLDELAVFSRRIYISPRLRGRKQNFIR
jgi:hypothetical protein